MEKHLTLAFASLLALACTHPALAAPSSFDGTWSATLDCPSNTEKSGARGYTLNFLAQVENGMLAGQYGAVNAPGSLKIAGQILPDGSAMLHAVGRTADPVYSVNRVPADTGYAYDIQMRFDGTRGTGTRLTTRKCDLAFVRQRPAAERLPLANPDRPAPATGANRIALVIGNSAYRGAGALKNPVNDAKDISETLGKLGFHVILKTDVTLKEMTRAITVFGEQIKPGDVALFYYAGHGLQAKGRNFMVPVDAEIGNEASIRSETVDVDLLLEQLAPARLSIVILDACRNNPYERGLRNMSGSGLAQIDAPKGTLIAYATSPGRVAADGGGRNGLYTGELLRALVTPGINVESVFKKIRVNVAKSSADRQIPWESSSMTGEFCFAGCAGGEAGK